MATAGAHDRQQNAFDTAIPYRPQPSSPTLTNPDMILPDYEEPAQHLNDDRDQSSLLTWNNAAQVPHEFHDFQDFSHAAYNHGGLATTTPIIYGNGTMLSDIGEVTEVESNAGHQLSRRPSHLSATGSGSPLRSSPTMGKRTLKKRPNMTAERGGLANRERRLSIESMSSVNTIEAPEGQFGEIDDAVSVDDSNFQGDDEESMASAYMDETSVQLPSGAVLPSGQGLNENRLSTQSISKRAEMILANAKRRLTTMEGNLNRARTFSYSSVSDGSTPSPGGRGTGIGRDKGQVQPTTPTHSRNVSDFHIQGSMRATSLPQRSASALGAAGGYRQHLPLSRSADVLGSRSSQSSMKSPRIPHDSTLEPLDEDEIANDPDQQQPRNQLHGLGSPTFGSQPEFGLTRSASVAQVRDLQDQMQGLKGKISSLREQAKADSMKRRSLQSLRTPSPFTHARWEHEGAESRSGQAPEINSAPLASPWDGDKTPEAGANALGYHSSVDRQAPALKYEPQAPALEYGGISAQDPGETREAGEMPIPGHHDGFVVASDVTKGVEEVKNAPSYEADGSQVQNGDVTGSDKPYSEDVDFDDYGSESGDSLYHDTNQEPVAISHEDREDAFDYEHFFLHSAMGTLSRQRMSRSDSVSSQGSDDSVETTRGPTATLVRRPSIDTMTSVDTFETAREGRESRNSVTPSLGISDEHAAPDYDQTDSGSAKRSTFGGFGLETGRNSSVGGPDNGSGSGSGSGSDSTGFAAHRANRNSVQYRPITNIKTNALHRPSISSFESTGTTRSFPLVNRSKLSEGALTPSGSSPDNQLKQVADSLMQETASICDRESLNGGQDSPAIQTLSREDQLLVEQVVASLGRCVLGLTEAGKQGSGQREHYRQRIDAARRMLEGANDRPHSTPR